MEVLCYRNMSVFEGVNEMNVRWTIPAVCVIVVAVLMFSSSQAADTRGIDVVRQKEVLNSKDLTVIDDFVDEAVRELLVNTDFTSIARIRTIILSRSSSGMVSGQSQFAEQFSKSAHTYISEALDEASGFGPEDRRFKTIVNLLILVDGLGDLGLLGLGSDKLDDENAAVRYWAVHSLTNPAIIMKLNSGGRSNKKLAAKISEQLKAVVGNSSPESMTLIARFAGGVKIAGAEDLLLEIHLLS